ncbi:arylsulfatase [Luteolibacter algae]|uniref:Arylsulfatase n=1 Tax=Luteolibacter algae TaxID=454151 RepID=A0ABW5DB55_9BACT
MKFHLTLSSLILGLNLLASAKSPNIIILYADDMGYGDLAIQNENSKIPTPNLDQLAREGMRFSDGHSSSGICTPSRYSILTGRHHWRDFHGIVNAFGPSVFKDSQLTLPEMLREKGYTTACIGKWHLGWDWNALRKPDASKKSMSYKDFDWSKPIPDGPLDHGFDHYFGDSVINFPPYAWIEDDKLIVPPDTDMARGEEGAITKEGNWEIRPGPAVKGWDFYKVLPTLTEKSVEYIRSRKGAEKPFFLYLPFPSPHAPIVPTDEFDEKSQAGPYGDFVYQTDDACGRILRALDEIGETENTIVVFSADNGPEKYAYERVRKYGHWSSGNFRGLKRDIYEGGHHVPFIIRWPGVLKAGSVSDAFISQVDLMATLASVVKYPLPENSAEDSFDFLPYFKGETESSPRSIHVHNTSPEKYAIRQNDWLLIDSQNGYTSAVDPEWEKTRGYPADDNSPVELYDIKQDPSQKNNIASDHPEVVKNLQRQLGKIRTQGYSSPRLEKP